MVAGSYQPEKSDKFPWLTGRILRADVQALGRRETHLVVRRRCLFRGSAAETAGVAVSVAV